MNVFALSKIIKGEKKSKCSDNNLHSVSIFYSFGFLMTGVLWL